MMMAATPPGQQEQDGEGEGEGPSDDIAQTNELLRRREAEYLAGRPQDELPEVPGLLGLRQESAEPPPPSPTPTVDDCCDGGDGGTSQGDCKTCDGGSVGFTSTATVTLVSTTTATIAYVPSAARTDTTSAEDDGDGNKSTQSEQISDTNAVTSVNSSKSGDVTGTSTALADAGGETSISPSPVAPMTTSSPVMPPWLAHLARSDTPHLRPSSFSSFAGLVLWTAAFILQDIWHRHNSL